MDWTNLRTPNAQDWHKPDTAKARAALAKRIDALLTTRAMIDGHETKLLETPVNDVASDEVFQQDCPAQNRFDVLRSELALRSDLADWYALEERDRRGAYDAAGDALRDAEADVRKRLVSIGYVDAPPRTQNIGAIEPGFVLKHPEVRAARLRMEELRTAQNGPAVMENEELGEQVERELESLRRRAVRTAG